MLDFNAFIDISQRTKKNFELNLNAVETDLLHGAVGICGEAGELMDAVKKAIVYGKKLDEDNLVEELGDIMWYVGIILKAKNISMSDVLEKNVAKLAKRYPEQYEDVMASLRMDKV